MRIKMSPSVALAAVAGALALAPAAPAADNGKLEMYELEGPTDKVADGASTLTDATWRNSEFVYPLTRGPGPRLFPDGAAPGKLSLATSESYDNGVVYLAYRPH